MGDWNMMKGNEIDEKAYLVGSWPMWREDVGWLQPIVVIDGVQ